MVQKALVIVGLVVVAFVGLIGCPPPPPPGPGGPPPPPPGPHPPPPPPPHHPLPPPPPTDTYWAEEIALYSQLFAPNAPQLPPPEVQSVLDQLEGIYIDREIAQRNADMNELRRRMQIFSLASLGDVNAIHCDNNRFLALGTAAQFLAAYPNVAAYLQAKQVEQLALCQQQDPTFQPI